jgi:non-specific serine/threonine protein kinase
LEAVEAVCSNMGQDDIPPHRILDLVSRLVDKSLVVVEVRGQAARYRLLETVREYARERLCQAEEEAGARSRHLDFFLRLAEETVPSKVRAGEVSALNRLAQEHDNLRTALEWSAAAEARIESGLRLAGALFEFWQMGGYAPEGLGWLKRLLERSGGAASAAVRARALQGAGELAACQGDFHAARSSLEQGLALYRQLNDRPGIAYALLVLGSQIAGAQDEWAVARPSLEECLALYRNLGDRPGIATAMAELGYTIYRQGDRATGRALLEQGQTMQRELDLATYAARFSLLLGHIARQEGGYALARSRYAENMAALWEMRIPYGLFYSLAAFGCLAAAEKRLERAARLYGATERVGEMTGIVMVPHERTWHDPAVAAARAGLSKEAFAAAWAAGRAMTLEEAVAYALEETQ